MDLPDKLLERYEPHRIYPEEIVMTPAQMTELAELIRYLRDEAAYITDTEEYKEQAAKIEELKEMYRNAKLY